jgi:DNA modification methylase
MEYSDFIKSKEIEIQSTGIESPPELGGHLFHYQKDIVTWALKKGRAAIFSGCGTGKTAMQLEWAKHIANHTQGDVLILAPLAVASQTIREGEKFGIAVNQARQQAEVQPGINIANYEMLHKFDTSYFAGVVLDESSILKNFAGKYRNLIIDGFSQTRFKLACTATPSPNDFMELGNHSEFLNIMSRVEMLATFFVHDGGETSKWRLKGHAAKDFWRWICKWAVTIESPADLGYDASGFELPELRHHAIVVESQAAPGALIAFEATSLTDRRNARRDSLNQRVAEAVKIIRTKPDEPWLIWCDLNDESTEAANAIADAVEVTGSDNPEVKESRMLGFTDGDIRVLVSKPKIAGFGMNWQHCSNVIFLGLSDSFEQYYQAVRRCWRFGQTKPVDVYVITSEAEGQVVANIERKERQAEKMTQEIIKNMAEEMNKEIRGAAKETDDYQEDYAQGEKFKLFRGDCIEHIQRIESESVHYSIFSPPFSSLYTYSNSPRDMGNVRNDDEFMQHFEFLTTELHRILKPGRLLSFHCMNLPTSKQMHGHIGIRDFRGDLIRAFERAGFIYHSEVVIWKDPVVAMQRTKALGLLHKQLKKDSAMSRQGIPDYLVTMRKPGDNPEPVSHTNETFPVDVWQRYASPIWMDINPSDTLQYRSAREHEDERHICPLQLEVIRRALRLWTNPDDVVFTPFAGIGSELVVSLEEGRRAMGVELKQSYYNQAVKNCKTAENTVQLELPLFA